VSKVSPSQIWREAKRDYPLLNRRGKLLFYTRASTSYVGLIKLTGGEVVSGQIVDSDSLLKKGAKVRGIVRRLFVGGSEGPIRYGLKWRVEK